MFLYKLRRYSLRYEVHVSNNILINALIYEFILINQEGIRKDTV